MATASDPAIQASQDEATALPGEVRIKRDAGEFGLALELARQVQAKWPSSAEIKAYLAETGVESTAGMKSAAAQATAGAKAATAQATAGAKAATAQATAGAKAATAQATANARIASDAAAKEQAEAAETARKAKVVESYLAGAANRTTYVNTINKIAPQAGVFISTVKRGFDDDTAVLVLKNIWHSQPYQVRLQVAQSLLIIWQRTRNDEHSYVTLTDLIGNEVGSTSAWSGMSVIK
jgi:hypothetical protein